MQIFHSPEVELRIFKGCWYGIDFVGVEKMPSEFDKEWEENSCSVDFCQRNLRIDQEGDRRGLI